VPPDGGEQLVAARSIRFPSLWRAAVIGLAGLYGAAGVMLAAISAHVRGGQSLATAADFLMVHASLVIGLAALAGQTKYPRSWLFLANMVLVGVTFFSGDVALSTLAERRLFPMAAPTGGTLLIACWLGISVLATFEMIAAPRNPGA
jgi:uncharacterized membrane protein YgdD (TMEM256/DUF423 family)